MNSVPTTTTINPFEQTEKLNPVERRIKAILEAALYELFYLQRKTFQYEITRYTPQFRADLTNLLEQKNLQVDLLTCHVSSREWIIVCLAQPAA